ncbi:MAG: ATP-dependent Clp protease adaptor ClpS [Fimbriimonadales bacterium]|nr:ATP-dependent Clp protease adaptor ClpS [Fimbriimonadales bacterium]
MGRIKGIPHLSRKNEGISLERLPVKGQSTTTIPEKRERISDNTFGGGGWAVIVYDNDYNTYEEVIHILQVATGCSQEEAFCEAWEIDHYGSCVVHRGGREECEQAANIIATIGIRVEVAEDT